MSEFNRINEIVETTNTTDFRIQSYDSANLLVTGSFDFCYYHEVEVEFRAVSYISLPSDFNSPNFRRVSTHEIESIRKLIALEPEDIVYCIEAGTSCSIVKLPFYIVAESVTVREGLVFYYERENLKEGERIAAWVQQRR
jgi:hypothetical protein